MLLYYFLPWLGSTKDGRIGIGYLIEGRSDCPGLELKSGPLGSFLCQKKKKEQEEEIKRRGDTAIFSTGVTDELQSLSWLSCTSGRALMLHATGLSLPIPLQVGSGKHSCRPKAV